MTDWRQCFLVCCFFLNACITSSQVPSESINVDTIAPAPEKNAVKPELLITTTLNQTVLTSTPKVDQSEPGPDNVATTTNPTTVATVADNQTETEDINNSIQAPIERKVQPGKGTVDTIAPTPEENAVKPEQLITATLNQTVLTHTPKANQSELGPDNVAITTNPKTGATVADNRTETDDTNSSIQAGTEEKVAKVQDRETPSTEKKTTRKSKSLVEENVTTRDGSPTQLKTVITKEKLVVTKVMMKEKPDMNASSTEWKTIKKRKKAVKTKITSGAEREVSPPKQETGETNARPGEKAEATKERPEKSAPSSSKKTIVTVKKMTERTVMTEKKADTNVLSSLETKLLSKSKKMMETKETARDGLEPTTKGKVEETSAKPISTTVATVAQPRTKAELHTMPTIKAEVTERPGPTPAPNIPSLTQAPLSSTVRKHTCYPLPKFDSICKRRYRGYFKNSIECESFIVCEWGHVYYCYCPPRTRYNSYIQVCDWWFYVPCENGKLKNNFLTTDRLADKSVNQPR